MLSNKDTFGMKGVWSFVCKAPNGIIKWIGDIKNIATAQGLDHVLDVVFHNATKVNPWYIGLKHAGNASTADTLSSHAGWTECANYTGNRKEFVEAAASSGSITNSASKASFSINANNQVIAGGFLCSAETGTSGTLFSVVDFTGGNKTCDSGDTLEVTYTISANNV